MLTFLMILPGLCIIAIMVSIVLNTYPMLRKTIGIIAAGIFFIAVLAVIVGAGAILYAYYPRMTLIIGLYSVFPALLIAAMTCIDDVIDRCKLRREQNRQRQMD